MKDKEYQTKEKKADILSESEVAYVTKTSSKWDPNIPFHATQEEWWEHIHEIEQGVFYPVDETFQRVEEWMNKLEKE